MFQTALPQNYWHEDFVPGSMSVQQLNEYPPIIGQFNTYASTSKVGSMKSASFFRTKGFKPKAVWSFNPFQVMEYRGISEDIEGSVTAYKNSTVKSAEYRGNPALFFDHEYPPYTLSPLIIDDFLADESLVRAFAKVQAPDADIGLMLAEIRDTIQMFTNPIQLFAKKWNKLHHGLSKMSNRKATSIVTSRWMEYRYGIMPLISDITSLMDLFLKKHEIMEGDLIKKKDQLLLANASSYGSPVWKPLGNTACYGYGRYATIIESRLNSSVHYAATLSFPYAKLGVSMLDIPSLLWEITPYSFVFDWFINFGSWLRAIQPKPGLRFLNASVSGTETYKERTEIIAFSIYPQYCPWVTGKVFCSYEKRTSRFTRTVGRPLPASPQVNSKMLNLFRSLDSISMLWQNLPKPKGR